MLIDNRKACEYFSDPSRDQDVDNAHHSKRRVANQHMVVLISAVKQHAWY